MIDWFTENAAFTVWIAKITFVLLVSEITMRCMRGFNPRWQVWTARISACAILLITLTALMPPVNQLTLAWLEPQSSEQSVLGQESPEGILFDPSQPDDRSAKSRRVEFEPHAEDDELMPPRLEELVDDKFTKTDLATAFLPSTPLDPANNKSTQAFASDEMSEWANVSWLSVLLLLWGIGIAVDAIRWATGLLRSRQLIRKSDLPAESATTVLAELCRQANMRVPGLRVSDSVHSAAVVGLIRPTILLPESLSGDDVRYAIGHEWCHVRNRDLIWDTMIRGLRCALWPHPMIWILRSRHRAACESVSDLTVAEMVNDRSGYSGALARAALAMTSGQIKFAEGFAMARSADVVRRLRTIASGLKASPLGRRTWAGTVIVTAISVILGTSGVVFVPQMIAQDLGEKPIAAPSDQQVPDAAADEKADIPINVRVIDRDGQPLAEARVELVFFHGRVGKRMVNVTDESGMVTLSVTRPDSPYSIYGPVYCRGFIPNSIASVQYASDQDPDLITVTLDRGVLVGGKVVDDSGEPIVDAVVSTLIFSDRMRASKYFNERSQQDGTFQLDSVATGTRIRIEHPDYINDSFAMVPGVDGKYVLERGRTIRGVVRDAEGNAIPNASVDFQPSGTGTQRKYVTDADGRFERRGLPLKKIKVKVSSDKFRLAEQQVDLGPEEANIEFRLEPGKPLEFLVTDTANRPITGAFINVHSNDRGPNVWYGETDQDGKVTWGGGGDESYRMHIGARGFRTQETRGTPGTPLALRLNPSVKLSGKVTDQQTGAPIDSFEIRIANADRPEQVIGNTSAMGQGIVGRLDFELQLEVENPMLVIETKGYKRWQKAFDPSVLKHEFEIHLIPLPATPTRTARGRIVDTQGKLVSGATVILTDPDLPLPYPPAMEGIIVAGYQGFRPKQTRSDSRGRFDFVATEDLPEKATLVVESEAGYAQVRRSELPDDTIIRLKPWATLKVTVKSDGKPVEGAGVSVRYQSASRDTVPPRVPKLVTNSSGTVVFDRVVPGNARISTSRGDKNWYHPGFVQKSQPFEIKSGTNEFAFGAEGIQLAGQIVITPDPQGLRKLDFREDTGSLYGPTGSVRFSADDKGSFTIDSLQPGWYSLRLPIMTAKPDDHAGHGRWIDTIEKRFELTESDSNRVQMDFEFSWDRIPNVGDDAPPFVGRTPDGKTISSRDYVGKWLLVDFFSTQSPAYRKQLGALKQIHSEWNPKGLNFLSVAVDMYFSGGVLGDLSQLTWPILGDRNTQGTIYSTFGISTAPMRLLIDPNGKIVYRGHELSSLRDAIKSSFSNPPQRQGISSLAGIRSQISSDNFNGTGNAKLVRIEYTRLPPQPGATYSPYTTRMLCFYSENGSVVRRIPLSRGTNREAIDGQTFAFDGIRKRVYVIDQDEVIALDRTAREKFRVKVPGISSIAVHGGTGELWCSCGSSPHGWTIMLDTEGNESRRIPDSFRRLQYDGHFEAMLTTHIQTDAVKNAAKTVLARFDGSGKIQSQAFCDEAFVFHLDLCGDRVGTVWIAGSDLPDRSLGMRSNLMAWNQNGVRRVRSYVATEKNMPPEKYFTAVKSVGEKLWVKLIKAGSQTQGDSESWVAIVDEHGEPTEQTFSVTNGTLVGDGAGVVNVAEDSIEWLNERGEVQKKIRLDSITSENRIPSSAVGLF